MSSVPSTSENAKSTVEVPQWLAIVVVIIGGLLVWQIYRLNTALEASRAEAAQLRATVQQMDPAAKAIGRVGEIANEVMDGVLGPRKQP